MTPLNPQGTPSVVERLLSGKGLSNQEHREIATLILTLQERIETLEARIEATVRVIDFGYYGEPGKLDKCPHGQFGYEDCITCYDEALMSTLSPEGEG